MFGRKMRDLETEVAWLHKKVEMLSIPLRGLQIDSNLEERLHALEEAIKSKSGRVKK